MRRLGRRAGPTRHPRRDSLPHVCQVLEPRRLLAGAPAELLARLPSAPASVNVRFQDLVSLADRWVVTTEHEQQPERLYATFPAEGGSPGELVPLFSSQLRASSDNTLGITGLTTFRGEAYFFANGASGDALFATDGSSLRTVKVFRANNNALPKRIAVSNDRMYFSWDPFGGVSPHWSSDGTTEGTVPEPVARPAAGPPSLADLPNFYDNRAASVSS